MHAASRISTDTSPTASANPSNLARSSSNTTRPSPSSGPTESRIAGSVPSSFAPNSLVDHTYSLNSTGLTGKNQSPPRACVVSIRAVVRWRRLLRKSAEPTSRPVGESEAEGEESSSAESDMESKESEKERRRKG